jgi:antitoxin VapB
VELAVIAERRVKLFRIGRNQAIRIPREFELPGEKVVLRKEGDHLIIEPFPTTSLRAVLATLTPLGEEFPSIIDAAASPFDLG